MQEKCGNCRHFKSDSPPQNIAQVVDPFIEEYVGVVIGEKTAKDFNLNSESGMQLTIAGMSGYGHRYCEGGSTGCFGSDRCVNLKKFSSR